MHLRSRFAMLVLAVLFSSFVVRASITGSISGLVTDPSGAIVAGAYADIVVFDPSTVLDRATFEAPTRPAAGIEHVFVNGRPVWSEGKPTGERPGRALRRQQLQQEARQVALGG